MNNFFRTLIAGYGAYKLGGGCLSTILVFILIWVLLGTCSATLPPQEAVSEKLELRVARSTASTQAAMISPLAIESPLSW